MMKKFFYLLLLSAGLLSVACSSDEGYDADSAQSNYVPAVADKMLASVYTTSTIDGRSYAWKHNFSYDKHGRIKEVNSVIKHHEKYQPNPLSTAVYYRECDITSNAKYYYDVANLKITYRQSFDYPTYPARNYSYQYTDAASLNDDGSIARFVSMSSAGSLSFECNYKRDAVLDVVVYDEDNKLTFERDVVNDVTGYYFKGINDNGNDSIVDRQGLYEYTFTKNKTNFDFSAYFGYWGVERWIDALASWPYANYQLAAFGFFGTVSPYLPKWNVEEASGKDNYEPWEFDSNGYPVKYTDPTGRVTEITYVE